MAALLITVKHAVTRLLGPLSDEDAALHELFEAQQAHEPGEPPVQGH